MVVEAGVAEAVDAVAECCDVLGDVARWAVVEAGFWSAAGGGVLVGCPLVDAFMVPLVVGVGWAVWAW